VLLLGPFILLGSCGSRYTDLCDQAQACARGNETDYDVCIDSFRDWEDISEAHGCIDQWERYIRCFELDNDCVDYGTGDVLVHEADCVREYDDWYDCVN
jgi:hypothetical protein